MNVGAARLTRIIEGKKRDVYGGGVTGKFVKYLAPQWETKIK